MNLRTYVSTFENVNAENQILKKVKAKFGEREKGGIEENFVISRVFWTTGEICENTRVLKG